MSIISKNNDVGINILMMGTRRTGKTSILASMSENFDGQLSDTNLSISPENGLKVIADAKQAMKDYFKNDELELVYNDSTVHTQGINDYSLKLSIAGLRQNYKYLINFTDIEGEYVQNLALDKVKQPIMNSDVIIIAIDTVYLMEDKVNGHGRYNCNNNIDYTSDMIKSVLEDEKIRKNKLFLFIPLKCEKYYFENRMDEVRDTIKQEYSDLIRYLTKPNLQAFYSAIILPILTIGGMRFQMFSQEYEQSFVNSTTGKVEKKIIPADDPNRPFQLYTIYNGRYAPQFCEQPLLYTLAFLSKYIESIQKSKSPFSKLKTWMLKRFSRVVSSEEMICELKKVQKFLNKDIRGFEVIQDPLNLLDEV